MPLATFTLNTSSATKIAARKGRRQRQWLSIQNNGPGDVRLGIGVSAITTSKGLLVEEGCDCYISNEDHAAPAAGEVWAIGVTGAAVVDVTEGGGAV